MLKNLVSIEVVNLKKHKIILYCLPIALFVAVIIFILWDERILFVDRAETVCLEYVNWNGKEYSTIGGEYTEGRTIARDKNDWHWKINMVEEDPSHTFIVARGFLNQALLVSDDYIVPESGKLTTVCWDMTYITDELFLDAMTKIEAKKTTTFTYETEDIYQLKDNQHMRRLYFAYENCPVTTNFKGYMGKVNGKWVITTYISNDTRNEDGSWKMYPVSCYEIEEEYWDILSKYFS